MRQLTTVERLAQALGREELDDSEVDKAEYQISLISSYIIAYTDETFEFITATERFQADYYGVVDLPDSVDDVISVKLWGSDQEHPSWYWNGLDEIYNLHPDEVVDVSYSSGYEEIPEEIANIATEAVKRLYDSPSGDVTGALNRYRVGDVEEGYSTAGMNALGGLFNDLERIILNKYRTTATTFRVGARPMVGKPIPRPEIES